MENLEIIVSSLLPQAELKPKPETLNEPSTDLCVNIVETVNLKDGVKSVLFIRSLEW